MPGKRLVLSRPVPPRCLGEGWPPGWQRPSCGQRRQEQDTPPCSPSRQEGPVPAMPRHRATLVSQCSEMVLVAPPAQLSPEQGQRPGPGLQARRGAPTVDRRETGGAAQGTGHLSARGRCWAWEPARAVPSLRADARLPPPRPTRPRSGGPGGARGPGGPRDTLAVPPRHRPRSFVLPVKFTLW